MATLDTNLSFSGYDQPPFQRGELLGRGAHAQVFASTYPGTGSPVVLKSARTEENIFTRILKIEKEMLMHAQHPHVVRFRESYSLHQNDLTLVLDRIAPDLSTTYHHPLSANETITIGKQLLEALASFHAQGFIHRDLKPNNLSYDPKSKQLKLFDFGLATHQEQIRVGQLPQHPWYRAPEVFSKVQYDDRIDIWSVGCILFELYTGHALFSLLMDEREAAICLPRIKAVLSSSNIMTNWQKSIRLAAAKKGLAPNEAVDEAAKMIQLIAPMLEMDQQKRIRAVDALSLPGFQSDIHFKIQTSHFGPYHFHLYDPAKEEEPLLSIDLDRPKNVQNACLHVPANATNRFLVKIKDDDGQVVKSSELSLEKGQTIDLDSLS